MTVRIRILALLVAIALVGSVATMNLQQATAFGFVERQQIGEFKKLTGEFVQNVINRQKSPNSDNVEQFRILTAQFERDVTNAVLNDHLSQIPGITKIYAEYFLQHSVEGEDWMPYTQEVLRIFCKPCV
jgi:hypothetical protein